VTTRGRLHAAPGPQPAVEPAPQTVGEAPAAEPGPPIGRVDQLAGSVTATRVDGVEVALEPGAAVHQGDVIATAPDARVAIVFADGTTFSLSGGARMTLDELVFDPDAGSGSLLVSVLRGTFVFITGAIAGFAADAMQVQTPAGVLGIRGTTVGCTIDVASSTTACALLVGEEGTTGVAAFTNASGTVLLTLPFETVIATGPAADLQLSRLAAEEVRSLLAGALGEGGLPEAEAGLFVQSQGAAFDRAEFGAVAAGQPVQPTAPTGPLQDLLPVQLEPAGAERLEPFLPLEEAPEPEPPPPPPPEPTRIESAREITGAPVELVELAHDFGPLIPFPDIPDGLDVFTSPLFAEQGLAVYGPAGMLTFADGTSQVTVRFVSENAGFRSSLGYYEIALGYYEIAPDGRIGPPRLLTANASAMGSGGELIPGVSEFVADNGGRGFAPGASIGLFLIADGFSLNPVLRDGLAGLRFVSGRASRAGSSRAEPTRPTAVCSWSRSRPAASASRSRGPSGTAPPISRGSSSAARWSRPAG
jgi:hypothetical protein